MAISPYDQQVYDAGFKFIPQTQYLQNPFLIPEDETTTDSNTGAGIVTLPQRGGGGSIYTGGISDLTSGFQRTLDDRQARLTELNRPLTEAQFPSFPGPRTPGGLNAQQMYNIASEDLNNPFNRSAMSTTFPTRTAKEVMDYADDAIQDYRMQYATGELGPNFIPAEEPTIGRRIQDFIYGLPGFSKPQSADQIIAEGYTGKDNLPGILGMILGKIDQYGSLPRGDQAFIARNMGYTGPTVFGENASGLGKDPFGLNTRSGLGNYAEAVEKQVNRLDDYFGGEKFDKKYGKGTTLEFDEETGTFMFKGTNAAKANQMNKMNLARYNFYKQQVEKRDADRAAAAAAQAAAERKAAAEGRSDPADRSRAGASGRRPGSGGNVDRVTSGPGRNVDDTGQAYDSGGREGFGYGLADGGIVDMLEIYD